MSITDAQTKAMLAVAAVAVALVVYVRARGAREVGASAVRAVDGVVSGVVMEVGGVIGIPKTDAEKCAQAQRDGRTWDASFYCPAATFIRGIFKSRDDLVNSDPYAKGGGVSGYEPVHEAQARALAFGVDYGTGIDDEDYSIGQDWREAQPYRVDYRLAGRYKGMVGR